MPELPSAATPDQARTDPEKGRQETVDWSKRASC